MEIVREGFNTKVFGDLLPGDVFLCDDGVYVKAIDMGAFRLDCGYFVDSFDEDESVQLVKARLCIS